MIPQDANPAINFIGLLIGPRYCLFNLCFLVFLNFGLSSYIYIPKHKHTYFLHVHGESIKQYTISFLGSSGIFKRNSQHERSRYPGKDNQH